MFVFAVMAILAGMAIPQTTATIERSRTLGAARYLATRLAMARTQAVAHSANVALMFVADGDTYTVAAYSDGNRNGVRTSISPRVLILSSRSPFASQICFHACRCFSAIRRRRTPRMRVS